MTFRAESDEQFCVVCDVALLPSQVAGIINEGYAVCFLTHHTGSVTLCFCKEHCEIITKNLENGYP